MNSELKEKLKDILDNQLFGLYPNLASILQQGHVHKIIDCMAKSYNLDRPHSPSGGIKTAEEILRQHLHGFSDEQFDKEISHFPLCEVPFAMHRFHNQFAGDGWIENTITHLQGKIEPDADKQYFGSEYTKGRNNAFRLVITLLKKHLPSPPQNTKES